MKHCKKQNCHNEAIFLEDYCWDHLSEISRSEYKNKIHKFVSENPLCSGKNFYKIELNNVIFPKYIIFSDCNFSNVTFTNVSLQNSDFKGADFTEANLWDCRFDYSDFRGTETSLRNCDARGSYFENSSLQNVDLTNSDLRDCIFINADLIGAKIENAKLYASRLINTRFRKENLCNFKPLKSKNISVNDEFDENLKESMPLAAKYIYSSLKNNFRSIGEYDDERWAYIKERMMERKRLFRLAFKADRYSDSLALERWDKEDKDKIFESRVAAFFKWCLSWIQWLFGYGEKPIRIFFMAIFVIFNFSLFFMFGGFRHSVSGNEVVINRALAFNPNELSGTISDWLLSLYMSVITFSTLGYGDVHPIGFTRVIASVEAFLGLVLMAMFVAVFSRVIIRN